MKIVFLDAYTLNPGDLSWQPLRQIGETTIYDRTPPSQFIERAKDTNILILNKAKITQKELDQLPNLKLIVVAATGYNNVDTQAAKERGILVANVPNYGASTVAQHTIALILSLTNQVYQHHQTVQRGDWTNSPDWSYTLKPISALSNKTIGIVGYGSIGKKVATIAKSMGMLVLIHRKNPDRKIARGMIQADMNNLFKQSDIITFHCPLTDANKEIINRQTLSLMKHNALLINTARGGLINEQDLAQALNNQVIAGAALDVLTTEPPTANNPLLSAKNCIITPHIAWASVEARTNLLSILTQNIQAYIKGTPINIVNP